MLQQVFVKIIYFSQWFFSSNDSTKGTELLLTFLVHRHGDRTPTKGSIVYSNNIPALIKASEPYGYGELTNKGKRTAYKLGQRIRERYDELLSPEYNDFIIYIKSTDSTRTKMTVLTAMAAVFPPTASDRWSKEINWVPVPYYMVLQKYDANLAYLNCPAFITAQDSLFLSRPASMDKYSSTFQFLPKWYRKNVTLHPVLIYDVIDLYDSQKSLGIPLSKEVEENYSAIREAAGGAIDVVYGNKNYIALQAGVLLNEFYKVAAEAIAGKETQKVRVYSGHDFDVYSFEAVTQVPRQGVPKYGSAYALELRKVTATGQFVVLPIYYPSPDEDLVYLQVKDCDLLCDIEKFYNITSKYSMTEEQWWTKCYSN